ncbi:MAG TPA: hypothetical protein VHR47_08275 [Bacillota bacterium]|nr:hypothetical protein [Bacillota bacterium]
MKVNDSEDILRASVGHYELPQPPPTIKTNVMTRIEGDQRRRQLLHRLFQLGVPFGFIAVILLMSAWKPMQQTAAIFCEWIIPSIPTDLYGLIWYSMLWVGLGLGLFIIALLVMSGIRFIEE